MPGQRRVPDFATPSQAQLFQTIKSGRATEPINSPQPTQKDFDLQSPRPSRRDVIVLETDPDCELPPSDKNEKSSPQKFSKTVRTTPEDTASKNMTHRKSLKKVVSNSKNETSKKTGCRARHRSKGCTSAQRTQDDVSSPLKSTQKDVSLQLKTTPRDATSPMKTTQRDATLPVKSTPREVTSPMKSTQKECPTPMKSAQKERPTPLKSMQKERSSPENFCTPPDSTIRMSDVTDSATCPHSPASSATSAVSSSSESSSSRYTSRRYIPAEHTHVSSASDYESESDDGSEYNPQQDETPPLSDDSNATFPTGRKSVVIIPRDPEDMVEPTREPSPPENEVFQSAKSPRDLVEPRTERTPPRTERTPPRTERTPEWHTLRNSVMSPSDFIEPMREPTPPETETEPPTPCFKASETAIPESPVSPPTFKPSESAIPESPEPTTARLPANLDFKASQTALADSPVPTTARTPAPKTAPSPAPATARRAQTARAVIVMRHGERVDDCFGRWFERAASKSKKSINRGAGGYKPFDLNMPQSLATIDRPLPEYEDDTPLTVMGGVMAQKIGRCLSMMGRTPQVVYCSPALRCVQTGGLALKISRKPFIIRIEPGLFENTDLYPEHKPTFLTPLQLQKAGYDIDTDYTPYFRLEDLFKERETNREYNERVQGAIEYIVNRTCDGNGTVLIAGHASTVDLAFGSLHKKFKREPRQTGQKNLWHIAERIPYCGNVVFTRRDDEDHWHYCQKVIPPITYANFCNRVHLPYLERKTHTHKSTDSKQSESQKIKA
uniref:Phosphoglycerate mutase family protein n=1 Tax=Panagrellus redivivus TaxID=6233 RepID=A0A7E4UQ76_PANRE